MQTLTENPQMSTRKSALEHKVSEKTIRNILGANKFYPHKVALVMEHS